MDVPVCVNALLASPLPAIIDKHGVIHKTISISIDNISQRRLRTTDPRPQATYTGNLVKFRHVLPEIWQRTDKQRDRQTRSSQSSAPLLGMSNYKLARHWSLYTRSLTLFRSTNFSLVRPLFWHQNYPNFSIRLFIVKYVWLFGL